MDERRQTAMALPPEDIPRWKVPEGLKLFLVGAMGGTMIALLLGAGFIWC